MKIYLKVMTVRSINCGKRIEDENIKYGYKDSGMKCYFSKYNNRGSRSTLTSSSN